MIEGFAQRTSRCEGAGEPGRRALLLVSAAAILLLCTVQASAALLLAGQAFASEAGQSQGQGGSLIAVQGSDSPFATLSNDGAGVDASLTSAGETSSPDLIFRGKPYKGSWQTATISNEGSSVEGKSGLNKIKLKLSNLQGMSGSIRYKTYVPGSGWSKVAKDGKASGSAKKGRITALRVYLKGEVANYYDVWYRTYIKGIGWLGWTRNNKISGATSSFGTVSAIQVMLVGKTESFTGSTRTPHVKNRWKALEYKYLDDEAVGQLLEVKYKGGSSAQVVLRNKVRSIDGTVSWKTALSCSGRVGSRGIGSAREWLARTPSGNFGITSAFGIKDDPGAKLEYVKVDSSMYWCSDRSYYNELIDIDECPHDCTGEHLIDYRPYYNYGLFFDYNTNPVRYGKGSAFFVHCLGGLSSTGGCIAVSQKNMIKILRIVDEGARLCIYPK